MVTDLDVSKNFLCCHVRRSRVNQVADMSLKVLQRQRMLPEQNRTELYYNSGRYPSADSPGAERIDPALLY